MKRIIKNTILICSLLFVGEVTAYAADTDDDVKVQYKYRVGGEVELDLVDNLSLNIEPELRFNEGYDKFLLSSGLSYKSFGCIYWGATYRLVVEREGEYIYNSGNAFSSMQSESEYQHRYALDVTYKDKFGRFTPSFRIRYDNYADGEITDREFLRYKAKLAYNIRNCKIAPFVEAEGYQELEEMMLYKMRYGAGFKVKVGQHSSFSFNYKFDLFTLEYKDAHIFSVSYKYKF